MTTGAEPRDADRATPRSAAIEWAVLGVVVALFAWKGLLAGWSTLNTDFPNYYLGGKLFRAGLPLERLYDWVWMQREKDHLGLEQPLVGYLPSTLWSTFIVVPLTWLPPLAAKRVWLIVNLGLLGAVGALLGRLTRLGPRRIALILFLAIVPLRTNFQFGQQHLVVLFLLTAGAWAYFHERPVISGTALALAAALKLYPAIFVFYFWRKRQWRALVSLLVASVAIVALGVALFGFESLRVYVVRILPRSLKGEYNDPYLINLNSVTTLLRRLLVAEPELNPHPLFNSPALFGLLQPIGQALIFIPGLWLTARGRSDAAREKRDWAAFVVMLLMLSSGTSTYHLCALILPAALLVDHFLNASRRRDTVLCVVFYGLVCFPYGRLLPVAPAGWRIFLGFPRLYALAALWILVLCSMRRDGRATVATTQTVRRRLAWVAAFALLAAFGVASNARHLAGQFVSYAARVPIPTPSLIATTPSAVGGDIYFTRMDHAGYVIDRTGPSLTVALPAGFDLFFPATTAASPDGWVELASTRSRVVRFPRAATQLGPGDLAAVAEDAQQPAVSPDARWLGFIRTTRGRGSLWVIAQDGASPLPSQGPGHQRQLIDSSHDVLDFSFLPDGRIALAAFDGGRSRLFLVDPRSSATVALQTSQNSARYPAASPDGRWLAYAEEEHGQWQLWTLMLSTGQRIRRTAADCNSVTPAWSGDSRSVVYASDCGRGLGHTALCRIAIEP